MKIGIVLLFGIISVSSAVEFINTTTTTNATNATTATTATPNAASNLPKIIALHYNATATQKECSMDVLKFPGAYLRGAKAPNIIAYNNVSNLKACQKLCCYEKSFQCLSLSYLRPLHQCFLMNLTRHDDGVELTKAPNMVHVQTLTEFDFMTTQSPEEKTTEIFINTTEPSTVGGKDPTTISQDENTTESPDSAVNQTEEYTTDSIESTSESDGDAGEVSTTPQTANSPSGQSTPAPNKDGSKSGDSDNENPTGDFSGPVLAEKRRAGCADNCSTNGRCTQETLDPSTDYFCECNKGFQGRHCETEVTQEGGLAVWIIVVIVIAILILILIIVACVLMRFYKKKGEYRVVDYFRRWTRRQKKPKKPDNPNEIAHMEDSDEAFPPNGKSLGLHEDSTRTAV